MKIRVLALVIGMSTWFAQSASAAQMFDFNFSGDSAQVRYSTDISGKSAYSRSEYGFGALYQRDKNTMVDAWFQISDEAGSKMPGLQIGLGPKLYAGSTDSDQFLALGLGGTLRYRPQQTNRILLIGSAYYAPGIVTFLDAKSMWEMDLRVGYEVIPSAIAYISYRVVRVDFSAPIPATNIDKGVSFGLQMMF